MKNILFVQHNHEVDAIFHVVNEKNFTDELKRVYEQAHADKGWSTDNGYLNFVNVPCENLPCVIDEIVDVYVE